MYNYEGRFFAFGCSFTASNSRPTWADIVGQQFTEYQNWARGGMGNQFIFNQLVESNLRNKFTTDDTVIIMWSSITREDRYVKDLGGWYNGGNVFQSDDYSFNWIKKFACTRGYLIRDLATILAARDLLTHWGVNYKFLSMIPLNQSETYADSDSEYSDVIDLYKDVLADIKPSIYEIIFNLENWQLKKSDFRPLDSQGYRDAHPDPKEALEYVQTVLPELNIGQDTIDYVNDFKYGDIAPQFYLVDRL
jgi:hypothetical protein